MKYSTKLSDAIHILIYIIINSGKPITSDQIAESIRTNPGCVRQIMTLLKKQGIIKSVVGQPRPSLAKNVSEITLLDIYNAVEKDKAFLHLDMQTNRECIVGIHIQSTLQNYYDKIQNAAEKEMQEITLQEIMNSFYEKTVN
ncbi:MAG: Rrf2 family transcriptional regulator [Lachnospiraceae bacterium]|nr:Rrf2 family transcriptional regulator [Lachnospiraceae bacterium]MDD3617343.1 Rrf2 family transcriptional regulator [Lachnospiraceae bacterium]